MGRTIRLIGNTNRRLISISPLRAPALKPPLVNCPSRCIGTDDGSVTYVEFYQDGVLLDTVNTPPYDLDVSGLAEGTYTFTAQAYDDQDGVSFSEPLTLEVVVTTFPGDLVWRHEHRRQCLGHGVFV